MSNRHVEFSLPQAELKEQLRRRTRRSFLIGGLAAAAGVGAYELITSVGDDDGQSWALRHMLDFNGWLGEAYLSDTHLMPTYSRDQITYLKPNGDIGLRGAVDAREWRLQVKSEETGAPLLLQLADVLSLPKINLITRFCCIEGWSAIVAWGGARFRDFTRKYLPPGARAKYVYLATPDGEYYVGLDMKSAMHPQTLLAYEQNGKPLTLEHGAPLRLVIPVKYGIKSIKRIGLIQYTNRRPEDYWAEEGYDWFAGL
jgi:DMSO/TMAO reductase YedYZ molybdopterin-dependent catalytic subunit